MTFKPITEKVRPDQLNGVANILLSDWLVLFVAGGCRAKAVMSDSRLSRKCLFTCGRDF